MAERNEINEMRRMDRLTADGKAWQYPTAAQSGHVEIELPTLPGSANAVERLHARGFGRHVIAKIESAMNRQGYLQTGPQQDGPGVLLHYAAAAEGSGLMGAAALGRLKEISAEFSKAPKQREYFQTVVKPYLDSLTPHRRR